jgi:hypothetical protein
MLNHAYHGSRTRSSCCGLKALSFPCRTKTKRPKPMGILALHSKNHQSYQSSSVPRRNCRRNPIFLGALKFRNAHLTQLSKLRVLRPTCCSNFTSANQNSLTSNIQATFKTKPIRTKHKKRSASTSSTSSTSSHHFFPNI